MEYDKFGCWSIPSIAIYILVKIYINYKKHVSLSTDIPISIICYISVIRNENQNRERERVCVMWKPKRLMWTCCFGLLADQRNSKKVFVLSLLTCEF